MGVGYLKLYRQIQDSKIWTMRKPFDVRSAWIDLLMLACYCDTEVFVGQKKVKVHRGQYVTSVRKLSERWGWSKDRVSDYLHLLESDAMIDRESDSKRTLITIVNYSLYQDSQDTNKDTVPDTNPDTNQDSDPDTNQDKNKNIKNIKKYINNNIYSVHFEEFWKHYPRKKEKAKAYKCYIARLNEGYSEDELLTACTRYADECKTSNREERYIKLGATFIGINKPFEDYLRKETQNDRNIVDYGTTERDQEIDRIIASWGETEAEDYSAN